MSLEGWSLKTPVAICNGPPQDDSMRLTMARVQTDRQTVRLMMLEQLQGRIERPHTGPKKIGRASSQGQGKCRGEAIIATRPTLRADSFLPHRGMMTTVTMTTTTTDIDVRVREVRNTHHAACTVRHRRVLHTLLSLRSICVEHQPKPARPCCFRQGERAGVLGVVRADQCPMCRRELDLTRLVLTCLALSCLIMHSRTPCPCPCLRPPARQAVDSDHFGNFSWDDSGRIPNATRLSLPQDPVPARYNIPYAESDHSASRRPQVSM